MKLSAIPKKVRLFFVNEETGKPIQGATIRFYAEGIEKEFEPIGDDEWEEIPQDKLIFLKILSSNHAGYLSFQVPRYQSRIVNNKETEFEFSRLIVSPLLDELELSNIDEYLGQGKIFDITDKLLDTQSAIGIPIIYPPLDQVPFPATPYFPSVPEPDCDDWRLSPDSFGTNSIYTIGENGCEELMISQESVHSFSLYRLLRKPSERPEVLSVAQLVGCEINEGQGFPQRLCYRIGAKIDYEVNWIPLNHGLGKILYSLPLAPCESVNLAIIDWSRTDSTTRSEQTTFNESLVHNQRRDRTIDEVMEGVVKEKQRGGSLSASVAIPIGTAVLGIGGGFSSTRGKREVTAESTQTLADEVAQQSGALRSLNSTVIVQASQAERDVVETRTVTNHNHCHALTVLYYEVVKHYCISIKEKKKNDIIYVKFPCLSFNEALVFKYKHILQTRLLDKDFSSAFKVSNTNSTIINKIYVKVYTENDSVEQSNSNKSVFFLMSTVDGRLFNWPINTNNAIGNVNNPFEKNAINTFSISLSSFGLSVNDIFEVGIHYDRDDNDRWDFKGLIVTTFFDGGAQPLEIFNQVAEEKLQRFEDDGDWWGRSKKIETDETEDLLPALINHLNCNKVYYSRLIWLFQDIEERAILFDKYEFELEGVKGRLCDFVKNEIIGFSGDYIAFPLRSSSLYANTLPISKTEERIISLPTRGAFAEAKLSNCNSCEEMDDTKYWDWQESPCGCDAPSITGITPGSRARSVDVSPTNFPSSLLDIKDPLDAPDPHGIGKLLEVLGKSDIFRDQSMQDKIPGLVEKAIEASKELKLKEMDIEGNVNKDIINPPVENGSGGTNGNQGTSPSSNGNKGSSNGRDKYTQAKYAQKFLADNGIDVPSALAANWASEIGPKSTTLPPPRDKGYKTNVDANGNFLAPQAQMQVEVIDGGFNILKDANDVPLRSSVFGVIDLDTIQNNGFFINRTEENGFAFGKSVFSRNDKRANMIYPTNPIPPNATVESITIYYDGQGADRDYYLEVFVPKQLQILDDGTQRILGYSAYIKGRTGRPSGNCVVQPNGWPRTWDVDLAAGDGDEIDLNYAAIAPTIQYASGKVVCGIFTYTPNPTAPSNIGNNLYGAILFNIELWSQNNAGGATPVWTKGGVPSSDITTTTTYIFARIIVNQIEFVAGLQAQLITNLVNNGFDSKNLDIQIIVDNPNENVPPGETNTTLNVNQFAFSELRFTVTTFTKAGLPANFPRL